MRHRSFIVVGLAAVTLAVPAFAQAHKHRHHAAEAASRGVDAPQFVRVGHNGYWVTTTWGCYTDEGQGRLQDCESATGGGGGS
jgi:hypothetical protein